VFRNDRVTNEPIDDDSQKIQTTAISTMTDHARLVDALADSAESLLAGLVVKPEIISRMRFELEEAHSQFRSDLVSGLSPTSPRFLTGLTTLASLYRRLYLGSVLPNESQKKTLARQILQFFMYFQYAIDLDPPAIGINDDFLRV
jgi:hypothetical protein